MNRGEIYKGALTGIPVTSGLNKTRIEKDTWVSNDVKLYFENDNKFSLTLNCEGNYYSTKICTPIKDDYFQLEIKCKGDYDTFKAYLYLFYNRALHRIIIEGSWDEDGISYALSGCVELSK